MEDLPSCLEKTAISDDQVIMGITHKELPMAAVNWQPSEGVTLVPARTWGGAPFLWFSARRPGRYEISITINAWRKSVDAAVEQTSRAGIDSGDLAQFQAAAERLRARYPVRDGSCVVEVTDKNPPPPPPPISGRRWCLILHESAATTPEIARCLLQLRTDSYLAEKKHNLQILDVDSKNESDTPNQAVAQWVARLKAAGVSFPGGVGLIVAELSDDGRLGKVLFEGQCPLSSDAVISLLKTTGG